MLATIYIQANCAPGNGTGENLICIPVFLYSCIPVFLLTQSTIGDSGVGDSSGSVQLIKPNLT